MAYSDIYIDSPIDSTGRIVIPMPIRKQYDIQPGDRLKFKATKDEILMVLPEKQA